MTYHSIMRAETRANKGRDEAIDFIKEAMAKGRGADQLPYREKKYITERSRDGFRFLFYKGYLFIVTEANVCVTMYKAPDWFFKTKDRYDGKNRIKNVKRYDKYYGYREKGDSLYEDILWS